MQCEGCGTARDLRRFGMGHPGTHRILPELHAQSAKTTRPLARQTIQHFALFNLKSTNAGTQAEDDLIRVLPFAFP